MRRDSIEEHERVPMLQSEGGLPKVRGKIEISDTNEESNESFVRIIRAKFRPLYVVLLVLIVVVIAVLVVLLILLFTVNKMDAKYSKMANFSNREEFMRLYEELMKFRTSPHLTTDSIISRLTPQQLEMAKLAGILPLAGHSSDSPFANIPPIMPVTGAPPSAKSSEEFGHKNNKSEEETQKTWHDVKCKIECNKQDVTIPPLLIISLDGFAHEYLKRGLVPSLDQMAECGARAKYMYPSYPSKTFPNHYTIATGLYPEAHGIVDNSVYDPEISPKLEDMKRTNFSQFYGGEPIWSMAVRQQRRMFCLFWPGCSFNITGYNPTVDLKYNKSMTYSSRVDKILDWLLLPQAERPSLIMAYFDQPDSVGHFHTNDRQVNLELIYLESVLNYLFSSLYKNGILDCTNIVILSDHGMQFLNERMYVNEMIDSSGMIVANGVVGRIHMANSTKTEDYVLDKLQCKDNEKFQIYDRKRIPKRFHYAKSDRIGDFVLSGRPGTIFFPSEKDDYHVTSDHGYDYLTESMHAIFFARGPNIRPTTKLEPFQNVELFNLFADLLRLNNDVPTNGTLGLLDSVYTNMNVNRENSLTGLKPAPECSTLFLFQKREIKSCMDSIECEAESKKANEYLGDCSAPPHLPGAFYIKESADLCYINLCSKSLLTSISTSFGKPAVLYETLTDAENNDRKNPKIHKRNAQYEKARQKTCLEIDVRYDVNCENSTKIFAEKRDKSFFWRSLAATQNDALADLNRLQFFMYEQFKNGPFAYLQNLTRSYIKLYKRITSITGTIYDFNSDGLADDSEIFWQNQKPNGNLERLPTHFFRIFMRCDDGLWHINGMNCRNASSTRILAFILPNQKEELNCLDPADYLQTNTARVRDIELLTNTQFFSERLWFPEKEALLWRTNITTSLWGY